MKSLRCICCAVEIKSSFFKDTEEEITKDNVNSLSFENGMGGTMSYGYGCELDGDVYMFAICEDCTRRRVARGHMILVENYINNAKTDPSVFKELRDLYEL